MFLFCVYHKKFGFVGTIRATSMTSARRIAETHPKFMMPVGQYTIELQKEVKS